MDNLIHVANVAILISFLVRDILWLRVLSIVGGLSFMGYFGFAIPEPMLAPIGWNLLFMIINGVQIGVLVAERRPVYLDEQQTRVHELAFANLTPRELLRLLSIAEFRDVERDPLIRDREPCDVLMLVLGGTARVECRGDIVATLGPGRFVGEMSFLTKEPPTATVVAQKVEVVVWPANALEQLLECDAHLRAAVQRRLGADLALKLRNR